MLKLVFAAAGAAGADDAERFVVITDTTGGAVAYGSRSGGHCWVHVPRRVAFRFRRGSDEVVAYPEADVDSPAVLDAYHTIALPIAVQVVLGQQAIHASAVVVPNAGVAAFCGFSHSGKTTVAYGLNRRGYQLWGDDVVAFDASGTQGVTSMRLPFELNLRRDSARHFESQPTAEPLEPREWVREALAGLFLIGQSDGPSIVRQLGPKEALLALLAHAFRFEPQTPDENRRMMSDYLAVVASAPVFTLTVRRGFDALSQCLDDLEEALRGLGRAR